MPTLPGPPDDLSDEARRAWFNGAATIAQLQADQWAILAQQYREAGDALSDGDGAGADDDVDEGCPECGGELVESFGGETCLNCGTHVDDESAAAERTESS